MAGGKVHGGGGTARRGMIEQQASLARQQKSKQRILRQAMRRKRKTNEHLIGVIRGIARPEIMKEWARWQRLVAKSQLKKGKIRQFTFYCRLLAIDALYQKYLPQKPMRIRRVVFKPAKEGVLDRAQKRDILEKPGEMETNLFKRKELVEKQMKKLHKTLPETIQKAV